MVTGTTSSTVGPGVTESFIFPGVEVMKARCQERNNLSLINESVIVQSC